MASPIALKRGWLLVAGAFLLALAFRISLVNSWHAPAGDGVQYWSIANELRRAFRMAFAPQGPLTYARLPGYPLFTAALKWHPVPLPVHVMVSAAANVVFDVLTATFVLLLIVRLGLRRRAAVVGFFLVLLYPSLMVVASFALSESMTTCLLTGELLAMVWWLDVGSWGWAVLAGALAGLAQLIRADSFTVVPAMLVALAAAPHPLRTRARAAIAFAVAGLVVFSPWPIRNWIRFGEAHVAACTWRTMTGTPLPTGPIEWARTWASSQPGEGYFEYLMANARPLPPEKTGVLMPVMADSPEEHDELKALFDRYNREGMSAGVDEGFRALAARRRAGHPFRVLVGLPAGRIARLWSPIPSWELPFRVPWIPESRFFQLISVADKLLFALAAIGAFLLWRRRRLLAAILLAPIAARTLLYGYVIPHGTTGRYLLEAVPLLVTLGVVGATGIYQRLTSTPGRGARPRPAGTHPTSRRWSRPS